MNSDLLFELINSLNRNEKGYVKKYAQQHVVGENNNYIILFNLIDKQKSYDEKTIKQHIKTKLKDDKFYKNFAVVKNYLYNFLLKALTAYHSQNSYNAKAATSLHTIQILIDKAQYKQASKLIEKTLKFARKSENFTLLLEVLKLKVIYLEAILENEKINATYEEIFNTETILFNLNKYRQLHHLMYSLAMRLGTEELKNVIKEAKVLLKNKLLQTEEAALCNEAKIRYNEIHLLYNYMIDDTEAGYKNSTRTYELSCATPYYKEEKQENYVSNINNLLIFCNATERYEQVAELLQELRGMITKDPTSKLNIRIFATYGIQETNLYISTQKFELIKNEIDNLTHGLTLFEKQLLHVQQYIIFMNISICYFAVGNYRECIKWVNKILNGPIPETRHDVVSFAHVLSALTHYELGHYDLLDYLAGAATRYFDKSTENTNRYNQVIALLKELSICTSHIERKHKLQEFAKKHKKSNDPLHSVYSSFDVLAWVNGKVNGANYADALN